MALNKPSKSPSLFKKRLGNGLVGPSPPLPSSAASYLSALSQADAHARARSASPTSTPALSLSSSVTSSSEDTILHENDDNPSLLTSNTDGLLYPSHPPTSEQVFTTVHTEFGHCANEQYRTVSQHKPGSLPVHVEQDPPYYILLSTYISYLILICLGHVRDFVGKRFHPSSYHHLMPRDVSNLSLVSLHCSDTESIAFTGLCSPQL
jgi:serine palmitoyltransferase